jgi:phosphate/phosphite/phosphonate ABC transporters, periplasmic binding protein
MDREELSDVSDNNWSADRRTYLKTAGAAGVAALAGCAGTQTEGSSASITFGGDATVNFGISPSVPQSDLEVQYSPLIDHLETYLQENYDVPDDLTVQGNTGSNYSAVIQSLGEGTTDVAETGPFAAALGADTENAEIILQRFGYGSWTYKSIIATPTDSDITELSDLSGATVAFSDRLSTSGALYPLFSMSSEGGLNVGNLPEGNGSEAEFEARFAGGHVGSYTLLEEGQVDAAGMGGFVRDTKTGPTPDEFSGVATTLHEDERAATRAHRHLDGAERGRDRRVAAGVPRRARGRLPRRGRRGGHGRRPVVRAGP